MSLTIRFVEGLLKQKRKPLRKQEESGRTSTDVEGLGAVLEQQDDI